MNTLISHPGTQITSMEELRWHLRHAPRDLLFLDMLSLCGVSLRRLTTLRGDALVEEDGRLSVVIPPGDGQPGVKIPASAEVAASFSLLRENGEWSSDGPLFCSRKGHGQLSLSGASRMVKRWEEILPAKRSLAVALRNSGRQGVEQAIGPARRQKRAVPQIYHGELYKKLFDAIVNHDLPPGERLTIDEIHERFGASQGPIREALQKLQALGLIIKNKNKLYVAPLSKKDFRDIVEARILLECRLAEEAVPNISRGAIAKLEKMHNEFIAQWEGRFEGLFPQYDRQFHLTIYKAADKPVFFSLSNGSGSDHTHTCT